MSAQPALLHSELPPDQAARQKLIELRAVPDALKPALPVGTEQRLVASDKRSAECYSAMEEATYRLRRLTEIVKQRRQVFRRLDSAADS